MTGSRDPLADIAPGAATDIAQRLVALGDAGMASGIDENFDIDAFIAETAALQFAPQSAPPPVPPAG